MIVRCFGRMFLTVSLHSIMIMFGPEADSESSSSMRPASGRR